MREIREKLYSLRNTVFGINTVRRIILNSEQRVINKLHQFNTKDSKIQTVIPEDFCIICMHGNTFIDFNGRKRAQCSNCMSLERNRIWWLYMQFNTDLFTRKHIMLHFAPEKCFQQHLKNLSNLDYQTIDLYRRGVDHQMDICELKLDDDYFSIIYCSHVLEHVTDDIKAMSELYRVVKPDGRVYIMVPINNTIGAETDEDFSLVTPEERLKKYGQHDHVRLYGMDIVSRLQSVGFEVETVNLHEQISPITMKLFGISREAIFVCKK